MLKRFLFLLPLVFLNAIQVLGCICNLNPPPCFEYWRTDAVFTGRIRNVGTSEQPPQEEVEIDVIENFRGMAGVRARTWNVDSSCTHRFVAGDIYLFYSNLNEKEPGRISSGLCSRTSRYQDNLVDFEFLNSVRSRNELFWVWGTISSGGYDTPVKGIKAELLGQKNRLTAFSDDSGNIKFVVPGARRYKVRVFLPAGTIDVNRLLRNDATLAEMQRNQVIGGRLRGKAPYIDYKVDVQANKCGWFDVSIFTER